MRSAIGLNICAKIAKIKKYKSIIKKKKRKHDEVAVLPKANLDWLKDLISSSLTDLYIKRDHFQLIDVFKKYDYIKEKINIIETS